MSRAHGVVIASLVVMSCGGGGAPSAPTRPVAAPGPIADAVPASGPSTPAADPAPAVVPAPSAEAEPTPDRACSSGPLSAECRCESGDRHACLDLAEATFTAGDHDLAILRAYGLCQQGVVDGCLAAADYMTQVNIRARFGTSAVELRDRAVALYRDRCAAGDPPACFHHGKLLLAGKHVAVDVAGGRMHLEAACAAKHAPACAFLAGALDVGARGLPRDGRRATQLLDLACQAGGAASCTVLGDKLTKVDRARAHRLYEQACAGEDGAGCARVGALRARARQPAEAYAAFSKACARHDLASCVEAGALADAGAGAAPDPARARELYRVACEADVARGCVALAALVGTGRGGPRNWGEAVALADRACAAKHRPGCAEAARLRRSRPDARCTTEAACDALCDEGIGPSCTTLGDLRADRDAGHDACTDASEAYERGCDHGDGASCLRLGRDDDACARGALDGCVRSFARAHRDASDATARKAVLRSLEAMCSTRRIVSACVQLAVVVGDGEKSERLLTRACDQGNPAACRLQAYALGVGNTAGGTCCGAGGPVPSEAVVRKGQALLRRACALGDLEACMGPDVATFPREVAAEMAARGRELARAQTCGRAGFDVEW